MPLWLIRLTPARPAMLTDGPTPDEARTIARHFDYFKAACDRGTVLLFGRTANNDPDTVGLCIFRAADEPAARAFLAADPCIAAGVMLARLDPYRLAGLNPVAADEPPLTAPTPPPRAPPGTREPPPPAPPRSPVPAPGSSG